MGDVSLTATLVAPTAAAFFFGLATGWFVWGGRERNEDEMDDGAAAPSDPPVLGADDDFQDDDLQDDDRVGELNDDGAAALDAVAEDAPTAAQAARDAVVVLAGELADAYTAIKAFAADRDELRDDLEALDAAVNRANGRLKLLLAQAAPPPREA